MWRGTRPKLFVLSPRNHTGPVIHSDWPVPRQTMPPAPGPKPHVQNALSKKRKQTRNSSSEGPHHGQPPLKKPKTGSNPGRLQVPGAVKHALLAQYYQTTLTLRQYLLDNLPAASRLRRRKIAAVGSEPSTANDPDGVRAQLARLLDTTLVGHTVSPKELAKAQSESRLQQWIDYSQKDDSHVTLSGGDASAIHFQSEVRFTAMLRGQEALPQEWIRSRLMNHGRLWTLSSGCYFHG